MEFFDTQWDIISTTNQERVFECASVWVCECVSVWEAKERERGKVECLLFEREREREINWIERVIEDGDR